MTTIRYTLTAGPEGADVTTANSGATLVNKTGTSPYLHYAAAAKGSGATFGVEASTTNGNALARFNADTPSYTMAISVEAMVPQSQPAQAMNIIKLNDDSASSLLASIFLNTNGIITFQDKSHAYSTIAASGVLAFGVMYRWEILIVGNSTTAGSVKINVYPLTGTTPVASYTSTTANMGTNTPTGIDLGNTGGVLTAQLSRFANVQLEANRITEIGKYSPGANAAPVVSAGSDKSVALNSTVSLNGTATDSDGTIATILWSVDSYPATMSGPPTIANANTLAANFPASNAGVYVIRLTATDNLGASTASVTTIYVPASSVTVRRVVENTGLFTVTGAANIVAALSDAVAASYLESPASPASPVHATLGLNPLNPLSGATLTLTDTAYSGSGALSIQVDLIESVSQVIRKTWTTITAGGNVALALTAAECATISTAGWQDLSVRVTVQAA
jgi:hypothetical protein